MQSDTNDGALAQMCTSRNWIAGERSQFISGRISRGSHNKVYTQSLFAFSFPGSGVQMFTSLIYVLDRPTSLVCVGIRAYPDTHRVITRSSCLMEMEIDGLSVVETKLP